MAPCFQPKRKVSHKKSKSKIIMPFPFKLRRCTVNLKEIND